MRAPTPLEALPELAVRCCAHLGLKVKARFEPSGDDELFPNRLLLEGATGPVLLQEIPFGIREVRLSAGQGLTLNGQPVELKKAYSDVYPLGRERTFTGFYADVSSLKPDTRHTVEVTLPTGLQPGQFQGLFFENVEAEFTNELVPPAN